MATTTRTLALKFVDSNDEKYSQSWRNIKADASASEVKTFADAILSNAAVFERYPTGLLEASTTTTTVKAIDISD